MVVKYHYKIVTEIPEAKATKEQLERLCSRYRFAREFCNQKLVLEIACGSGIGLGYLANSAKRVIGGDIDENILEIPKRTYQKRNNIGITRLSAEQLPFKDNSFETVLLYEAIYYVRRTDKFAHEVARVLRPDGILVVCTVNKNWGDFNPSPMSVKYLSAPELYSLLGQEFPSVELFGAFPVFCHGKKEILLSVIKRIGMRLRLIPKTMKGKEFFKRIFLGKLSSLPFELTGNETQYCKPVPIGHDNQNSNYKILFAVARKQKYEEANAH